MVALHVHTTLRIETIMDSIAERKLRRLSDPAAVVTLRISGPRAEDDDFFCEVEIVGLSKEVRKKVFGVDAIQALELSIRFGSIELTSLLRDFDDLRWEDAPKGIFGFHGEPPWAP